MCRFTGKDGIGKVWVMPLKCTTNADDLYYRALDACDENRLELTSVEPCVWAYSTAVRQREEWPWKAGARRPDRES